MSALLPPQDLDAERSVLGAILLDAECIAEVAEVVIPSEFYAPSHSAIFECMLELHESGQPIDFITVGVRLERRDQLEACGGRDYLVLLGHSLAGSGRARHHALLVREMARLRQLQGIGRDLVDQAQPGADPEELSDRFARTFLDAAADAPKGGPMHIGSVVLKECEAAIARSEGRGEQLGLPTGFPSLDASVQGLEPGTLTTVAARPAMGKSAFAMKLVLQVAATGTRVLVFSFEMPREQCARRFLVIEARGDATSFRAGVRMSEGTRERYRAAARNLVELPIEIDDERRISLQRVLIRARRAHKRAPLGLIVVDYLQLLDGSDPRAPRHEALAEIARSLRALGKELGVPVIALAQLNRAVESRDDKRPRLADLRESGSIEADSDSVWLLHRPHYYDASADPSLAVLIVAKSREGATGEIVLRWIPERATFEDPAGESSGL